MRPSRALPAGRPDTDLWNTYFWTDPYRAILVEEEDYAKELSRYLHLNPVRAR